MADMHSAEDRYGQEDMEESEESSSQDPLGQQKKCKVIRDRL